MKLKKTKQKNKPQNKNPMIQKYYKEKFSYHCPRSWLYDPCILWTNKA